MLGNGTLARSRAALGSAAEKRVIKRYSNRKLYDTAASRYVTLLEIADMVRAGEDVQVIDKVTREDKTDVTLALIISEELRSSPSGISLGTLRGLILRHGALTHQAREAGMVHVDSDESSEAGSAGEEVMPESGRRQAALGPLQQAVDERIRTVLPESEEIRALRGAMQQMAARVTELEGQLAGAKTRDGE